ncbi:MULTISPECIES: HAD family hydrolase [Collinsella]|uniref:HAD family phosphatase n=1 Tax=Collinsella ihumii TaxID=1720204 RepID=A0ABT7XGA0_9ACTN|nr:MULTISPECIES: HAD family phosphatase [Collinsella]MDN0064425.1 HAD family phosphatase [Collinsella ihumii]OUO62588.1 hypothetical protein B5F74_01585 [Collinsella sp. An271]
MAFPFKAVIFDMDGVIVDTEKFYFDELLVMSEELGLGITVDECKHQVGMSHQDFQRNLQMWMRRGGRGELSGDEAEAIYNEWASHRPRPYAQLLNPGVAETVEALHGMGVRVALASSSPLANIDKVLSACGLTGRFEPIVSGEQFHQSKPNPEIYLHTLELLGLPASACCCVEDSVYGIAAGCAAGLTVIAKREERFGFSQDQANLIIDQIPDLLRIGER